MIESIFLDLMLALIVVLMTAIGIYRGGMREAFSAAGLSFGVLLALEWAGRWGDWLGQNTNLSEGGARFVVSVLLMVLGTGLVGYGVGSSFNYHPGPGGRMFGAVLGAGSALVGIAYVLTWLRNELFDGRQPDVIDGTWFARRLDGDAGTMLLVIGSAIVAAALFASFVRERDEGESETASTAPMSRPVRVPEKLEPSVNEPSPSAPVRVRPARQWEDRAGTMPERTDREWSNTWPADAPGVPTRDTPSRVGEVQQARNRRRSQRDTDTTR